MKVRCHLSSNRILLRSVFGCSYKSVLIEWQQVGMSLLPLQAAFCPQQSYMVEWHLVSSTPSVTKNNIGFWLFYVRHQISDYTVHLVFINITTNQMVYVIIGDLYTNSDFQ